MFCVWEVKSVDIWYGPCYWRNPPQKCRGLVRVVKGFHSFTCHAFIHEQNKGKLCIFTLQAYYFGLVTMLCFKGIQVECQSSKRLTLVTYLSLLSSFKYAIGLYIGLYQISAPAPGEMLAGFLDLTKCAMLPDKAPWLTFLKYNSKLIKVR